MPTHRHKRVLGHARDYIARLGTRQEAQARISEGNRRVVEHQIDFVGQLDVEFLAPNASMLTADSVDLGAMIAVAVGAEIEDGAWPDMKLDVHLRVEVLKPSPSVADQFLDG